VLCFLLLDGLRAKVAPVTTLHPAPDRRGKELDLDLVVIVLTHSTSDCESERR
jgi:hypothetical protein